MYHSSILRYLSREIACCVSLQRGDSEEIDERVHGASYYVKSEVIVHLFLFRVPSHMRGMQCNVQLILPFNQYVTYGQVK